MFEMDGDMDKKKKKKMKKKEKLEGMKREMDIVSKRGRKQQHRSGSHCEWWGMKWMAVISIHRSDIRFVLKWSTWDLQVIL